MLSRVIKMKTYMDITGHVFHSCTAIKRTGNGLWVMRCQCGFTKVSEIRDIRAWKNNPCRACQPFGRVTSGRESECRNGHPRTPENMLMTSSGRVCGPCNVGRRERGRLAASERRQTRGAAPLAKKNDQCSATRPVAHAPLSKNCSREDWQREHGIKPKYVSATLDMRSF